MTEDDKKIFMSKSFTERKNRITSFFQGNNTNKVSKTVSASTVTRPSLITSSPPVDLNLTEIETSVNAITAFKDRESYLDNKEMQCLNLCLMRCIYL